jgi:phage baseplate assembly protein W
MSVDTPQFGFPFSVDANGREFVREQDDDDEIMDCVEVLLSTELGERQEVPDYGIDDPAFTMGGTNTEGILSQIALWEPRATAQIERNSLVDMVENLRVSVAGQDG